MLTNEHVDKLSEALEHFSIAAQAVSDVLGEMQERYDDGEFDGSAEEEELEEIIGDLEGVSNHAESCEGDVQRVIDKYKDET